MRHDVEAGAVAHRRGVQDRIAGRDRDRPRRRRRGSRRRAPGGSASRPSAGRWCPRCRTARRDRRRRAARPRSDRPRTALDSRALPIDDQPLEARRRVRRDLAVEPVGGEADARAGMLEDVAELGAVQLGIGRHRGEPGVPDRVERLEIVRRSSWRRWRRDRRARARSARAARRQAARRGRRPRRSSAARAAPMPERRALRDPPCPRDRARARDSCCHAHLQPAARCDRPVRRELTITALSQPKWIGKPSPASSVAVS